MQEIYISSIAKRINPYLLFFLICIVLYLPSSFLRGPFYPDEIRNIYIAKSISTPKDYFFLNYLDRSYYDKPPFYFWFLKLFLEVSPKKFLFLPILFNTLLAWGILSLNYFFLKREGFPDMGMLSSLLLSATGIFYGMTIIARMDILFLLCIFLSVSFLWWSVKNDKKYFIFLSSLFSFLAVFTKGALGAVFPLFIGLVMAMLIRGKGIFKKVFLINLFTFTAIAIWLFLFSQIDHHYFKKMVFAQTITRTLTPLSHKHSFFYYFPFSLLLFLPWSFLGIGYFLNRRKANIYSWEKLFIAWFIGGLIILSLISSKLAIYLLLLTIPFCGLTAKFFLQGEERLKRRCLYFTVLFFLLLWCITFYYFTVKKMFIPPVAFITFLLFAAASLLLRGRKSFSQLRIFFIIWFIVIQAINLIYLPMASNSRKYNKIASALGKLKFPFNKVYVTDPFLVQLSIYPLGRPIIYLKDKEDACEDNSLVIISQDKDFPCSLREVLRINNLSFFYKE